METPPQFYNIRDLVLLPELNPRAQLCEETISRYMESFDALPPVSIQEGTGVLVDGFHRVEAATRLGAEAIPVRMLDIPDEELHLYAGLGNCGHGRASFVRAPGGGPPAAGRCPAMRGRGGGRPRRRRPGRCGGAMSWPPW